MTAVSGLERQVFAGRGSTDFGIWCDVRVVGPGEVDKSASANRVPVPSGAAFNAAPLLTLQHTDHGSLILVGRCLVVAHGKTDLEVTVVIEEMWAATSRRDDDMPGPSGWTTVREHRGLMAAVEAALDRPRHRDPRDQAGRAVTIAKATAEHTRNAVAAIRDLRYAAEREFGDRLRARKSGDAHLADLIELSLAASRARDICNEAAREGLWVWRTDEDAYHAHRRQQDPTIAPRRLPRRAGARPWLPTLDAGVRQCRDAEALLREEVSQLHRLLEAASTISVSKDARAQEHFNFLATVGAVTLGLPALVLGVYGADGIKAFEASRGWIWPFVGCAGLSSFLIFWLTRHPGQTRGKRLAKAALILLFAAGITVLVPWVAFKAVQ